MATRILSLHFSSQPGVANAFGLIGAENNAIAPGKRPLSSMSPTIVLDQQGEPVLTVGAAGGPKIITQVLLTVIRHLDLGIPVGDAVAAPRFHHQWVPDRLLMESKNDETLVARLKAFGYEVELAESAGVTQAVGYDETERLIGVSDPRVPGKVGYGSRQGSRMPVLNAVPASK